MGTRKHLGDCPNCKRYSVWCICGTKDAGASVEDEGIFLSAEDIERTERVCDLGDRVLVNVWKYPHTETVKALSLQRFVPLAAAQARADELLNTNGSSSKLVDRLARAESVIQEMEQALVEIAKQVGRYTNAFKHGPKWVEPHIRARKALAALTKYKENKNG
jgi:hypothetical protein